MRTTTTLDKYVTKLDYSSGDPFYSLKKQQQREIKPHLDLTHNIDKMMATIDKFPRLKESLVTNLNEGLLQRTMRSGRNGLVGQQLSRKHIKERREKA